MIWVGARAESASDSALAVSSIRAPSWEKSYAPEPAGDELTAMDWLTIMAWGQGAYYGLTGIWPVVHMPSFLMVTGPKRDLWLVKTVGLCIAVMGLAMMVAGWRGEVGVAITVLAVGAAVALAGVDVWYWSRGVIPRIYLLDAVGEGVLIAGWIVGWTVR